MATKVTFDATVPWAWADVVEPLIGKISRPGNEARYDSTEDIARAISDLGRQLDDWHREQYYNRDWWGNHPAIRTDATGLIESSNEPEAPLNSADTPRIRGAGVMVLYRGSEGNEILFVRNAARGTWEFPGGVIEAGESAEDAALREVREELGATPHGKVSLLLRDTLTGVDYSTFIARTEAKFQPDLHYGDGELDDWQWASPNEAPEPLHPGVRMALKRLTMNELDVARGVASGELQSPQEYENIWLFAMRVTGTGVSYRPELREYVWRDPALYLNNDFLERCQGLPVIIDHPPTEELDTHEFAKRVIGSIIFAYIEGDEVWAVARIMDQDAARLMRQRQLSTSPAVVFRDPDINESRDMGNGQTLLVEGEPTLLDHLAICELGVWDKGGEPKGIAIGEPEMTDPMAMPHAA